MKLEAQDVKRVESRNLFRLMAEVYSITEEEAQDATMNDAAMYSYKVADAKPGEAPSWESGIPEDWSKNGGRRVSLDAVFRDLLKRGLVDEGKYIVTHSW